ncbi:hypothetical protein A0O36_02629 [Piscirickettsiaceae bacterium NZ-RLO1]|nr:hypothetical protein A0O36_02629 [Piscirickettsiaceae bacterium NZ-RLO1]
MIYPIVIFKDEDSDYGVVVPDLPGCITAGSTYEEALSMASKAVDGHISCLVDEGYTLPVASTIDQYVNHKEYKGGILALIEVDISPYLGKSKKINVTLPGRLIKYIDDLVKDNPAYKDRSSFLAKSAMKELGLD